MKNWIGTEGGKVYKTECSLCGDECENMSRVLWESKFNGLLTLVNK